MVEQLRDETAETAPTTTASVTATSYDAEATTHINVMRTTTTAAATTIPMSKQEKQGAKCCGCCCDYRRAVIIVDFIGIIFGILTIITFLGQSFDAVYTQDYEFEGFTIRSGSINSMIAAFAIIMNIMAIFGALHYNVYMVGVAIVWSALHYIGVTILNTSTRAQLEEDANEFEAPSAYLDIVIGAIMSALIIYPHAGFIHEVRRGILSRETYPREEYSCCCGPRSEDEYDK